MDGRSRVGGWFIVLLPAKTGDATRITRSPFRPVGLGPRSYLGTTTLKRPIFADPISGIIMAKTSKPVASPAPQPPYIKRAHLRNVPPLRDVKVDFKPGLNIIIGKNGSGKTNLMRLVSELAELFEKKVGGAGCELILSGGGHELAVLFKESKDLNPNHRLNLPRISTNRKSIQVIASSGTHKAEGERLVEVFSSLDASVSFNPLAGLFYDILSIWHGLPNHRMAIVDESVDLSYNDSGGMAVISRQENLWMIGGLMERALIDAIVPYDVGSPANKFASIDPLLIHGFIAARIKTCLSRLNLYLPLYSPIQAVRLSEQFQIYPNSAKDEIIVKGLVLDYLIGGDWLPFSALSDGTKRILYVIGELITAAFAEEGDSIEYFSNNKIIFLEEPELGIHPDQLQLLLQLIREVSNKHQVIMTTHSPQTLDMLSAQELDRITICEFIPGKGTQMRKLSAAKKNKAKAYLRDKGFLSEFWRFSDLEKPD